MRVLRRTTNCEINPVRHAMTTGQGGGNKRTEAKNGTKTTDDPIPAFEIRGDGMNEESLTTPSTVKATRAFQNERSERLGTYQSVAASSAAAAKATSSRKTRKLIRSNCGCFSVTVAPLHKSFG